jgi:hypothetical protein
MTDKSFAQRQSIFPGCIVQSYCPVPFFGLSLDSVEEANAQPSAPLKPQGQVPGINAFQDDFSSLSEKRNPVTLGTDNRPVHSNPAAGPDQTVS